MTGRLINADALYTLFVKMKSFGELTAKKAIRCVEEAPTVDAIPVEWLEAYATNLANKEKENCYAYRGYTEGAEWILNMIRDWKEK